MQARSRPSARRPLREAGRPVARDPTVCRKTTMNFKAKLQSVFGGEDERAVSPVIGVILMVAITVILAAVIATFVTGLGSNTSSNANAAVSVSENSTAVTVTLTDMGNSKNVTVRDASGSHIGGSNLTSVGESVGITSASSGDTISIVAIKEDGTETVVQTYEVN